MKVDISDSQQFNNALEEAKTCLKAFVNSFIYFPKLLVAAVNGPAIGVAVTTLQLCDYVYATESATFHTPFVTLGQTPEACSSYTFPLVLGPFKANEMLISGKTFKSRELLEAKFLTAVYADKEFQSKVSDQIKYLSQLPFQAILETKKLIRNPEMMTKLEQISNREVEVIAARWASPDFIESVMNFLSRKKPQSNL